MQLFYSALSPFARKVRVCAHELGLADRLVMVTVDPWKDASYRATNPLGQVPALVLDEGGTLYDSAVICEALDQMGVIALAPASGPARWAALTRQALGDGLGDAAIRIVRERNRSDPHADQIAAQTDKLVSGLDVLEAQAPFEGFGVGEIAVACVLAYFDVRAVIAWREGRPKLAAWFETVSRRDSMIATDVQIAKS